MTFADDLRFFGVFEMLHDMKLPRTRVLPVYSGYFAVLYDALSEDYTWDLPVLDDLAVGGSKDILELGCGNGRITVPLARAGHRVTGVDCSADMLALLRRKLSAESEDVGTRIDLVQQDMRDFALDRRFDVVILPANNLSLLTSAEDRAAVFHRVKAHLAAGGRFIFDAGQMEPERMLRQNQDFSVVPASSASAEHFVMSAHRYLPDEQIQLMNFYAERVEPDGMTERFLGSWTKAVFDEEHVLELIAGAGLVIVDSQLCELEHEHRRMKIYTCGHTALFAGHRDVPAEAFEVAAQDRRVVVDQRQDSRVVHEGPRVDHVAHLHPPVDRVIARDRGQLAGPRTSPELGTWYPGMCR